MGVTALCHFYLKSLFLLVISSNSHALFEDQVGRFDWYVLLLTAVLKIYFLCTVLRKMVTGLGDNWSHSVDSDNCFLFASCACVRLHSRRENILLGVVYITPRTSRFSNIEMFHELENEFVQIGTNSCMSWYSHTSLSWYWTQPKDIIPSFSQYFILLRRMEGKKYYVKYQLNQGTCTNKLTKEVITQCWQFNSSDW